MLNTFKFCIIFGVIMSCILNELSSSYILLYVFYFMCFFFGTKGGQGQSIQLQV